MTAPESGEGTGAATPHEAPLAKARRPWRRRLAWAVLALVVLAVALAVALLVGGGAALRSEAGSARLLTWVPGLKVIEPKGAVWGDFGASRIEWRLPRGGRLTLIEPRWEGLQWVRSSRAPWGLELQMRALQATSADLVWVAAPATAARLAPPAALDLPLGLRIDHLQLGRFQSNVTGPHPVSDLRGAIVLQQQGAGVGEGARHGVRIDSVAWQRWQLKGELAARTRGALQIDAQLQARSASAPAGQAAVEVHGPMSRLAATLQAELAAQDAGDASDAGDPGDKGGSGSSGAANGTGGAKAGERPTDTPPQPAAQRLNAVLEVTPFTDWPVPRAQVRAQAFDLQRLWSAWPATSLTGQLDIVPRSAQPGAPGLQAADPRQHVPRTSDLLVSLDVTNARPGLWDAGRLPVAHARATATLPGQASMGSVQRLGRRGTVDAQVGVASRGGRAPGTVKLEGRWDLDARRDTALALTLQGIDARGLHGAAPPLNLAGRLTAQGQPDDAWALEGGLEGRDGGERVLRAPVEARLAARWAPGIFTVKSLKLLAGASEAEGSGEWKSLAPDAGAGAAAGSTANVGAASGAGTEQARAASAIASPSSSAPASLAAAGAQVEPARPWTAEGRLALRDFDPAAWMPWPRLPGDAVQRTRLHGEVQLSLRAPGPWQQGRGKAELSLQDSLLLGVPLSARAQMAYAAEASGNQAAGLGFEVQAQADGNTVSAKGLWPGRLGVDDDARATGLAVPAGARADVQVNAPALAALRSWAGAFGWAGLTGQLQAEGRWRGLGGARWETEGRATADGVQADREGGGRLAVQGASARWNLGLGDRPDPTRPWQLDLRAATAQWGTWTAREAAVQVDGTAGAHRVSLQSRVDLPPRRTSSGPAVRESVLSRLAGQGAWAGAPPGQGASSWRSRVETLEVLPLATVDVATNTPQAAPAPWLRATPFSVDWQDSGTQQRWEVSPTRLTVFGAVLALQQYRWQRRADQPGQMEVLADLEPLRLAEVLARWQPQAGWGGDLTVAGRVEAVHRPGLPWVVNARLARQAGDLTLADADVDGSSALRLGIRELQVALGAREGVWTLTQQVDARVFGTVQGRQVVQARDPTQWPGPQDTITGEITARVANLRTLGVWTPPGWRLAGRLQARARVSGTLGAPQYEGTVTGDQIGAANLLQGINITDGVLDLRLQGDQARLVRLEARDGENGGRLAVQGDAVLGSEPTARLQLHAERFALLQRVDRRAVVSSDLNLGLTADALSAEGEVRVNEGLVDISQADAPTLGDDVNVVNRPGESPQDGEPAPAPAARRKLQVAVVVDLGSALRLRGRGVDTHLKGAVRLTTPNGRPSVVGTIATVDGTYAAYAQKLVIERGTVSFTGPVDNPRLDIQAMRAQSPLAAASDVKVGVLITGTAQDPRVRLYSEPPMSETEKLSWLVLGRGPTGLGGADLGLLQTAAAALLAGGDGGGPSMKDNVLGAIGLDELSVRQTDGAVRQTIVTVGKQLSNRWYVGYERSLDATQGTWQLIYRLAQRYTLRIQSGEDNAADLIWSWRWD